MTRSHVALHFDCLSLRNLMAPFTMLSASCGAADTIGVTWSKKPCFTWFQLSWPKEFNGAIYNTICHVMSMPMASFDQKSHVVPNYVHLDLTNSVEPFAIPLAWHDACADVSGITWPKESCYTPFLSSWLEEFSHTIYKALGIIWYWHHCQCVTLLKHHDPSCFNHLNLRNSWCHLQCCWSQMMLMQRM